MHMVAHKEALYLFYYLSSSPVVSFLVKQNHSIAKANVQVLHLILLFLPNS